MSDERTAIVRDASDVIEYSLEAFKDEISGMINTRLADPLVQRALGAGVGVAVSGGPVPSTVPVVRYGNASSVDHQRAISMQAAAAEPPTLVRKPGQPSTPVAKTPAQERAEALAALEAGVAAGGGAAAGKQRGGRARSGQPQGRGRGGGGGGGGRSDGSAPRDVAQLTAPAPTATPRGAAKEQAAKQIALLQNTDESEFEFAKLPPPRDAPKSTKRQTPAEERRQIEEQLRRKKGLQEQQMASEFLASQVSQYTAAMSQQHNGTAMAQQHNATAMAQQHNATAVAHQHQHQLAVETARASLSELRKPSCRESARG